MSAAWTARRHGEVTLAQASWLSGGAHTAAVGGSRLPERRTRPRFALPPRQFQCPVCGANPWSPCRTADGNAWADHAERIALATDGRIASGAVRDSVPEPGTRNDPDARPGRNRAGASIPPVAVERRLPRAVVRKFACPRCGAAIRPAVSLSLSDSLSHATAGRPRGCSSRPTATLRPRGPRMGRSPKRQARIRTRRMLKAVAGARDRWRVLLSGRGRVAWRRKHPRRGSFGHRAAAESATSPQRVMSIWSPCSDAARASSYLKRRAHAAAGS